MGGGVTKFFVSNLPVGCRPWDVADCLRNFGEITGMYFARKTDKKGNRFGFISFKNVKDVKQLEKDLDGTKMGGSKLKVNVARFANENVNFWEFDEKVQVKATNPDGKKYNVESKGDNNKFRVEGVSYRDMVAPRSVPDSDHVDRLWTSNLERVIKVHDEISAFFAFQEKAVVGRARDIKSLSALNVMLSSSGFPKAKVYYVGGLQVLIVFPEDYEATEFISNHSLWSNWFSFLDMWEGQSLPYERIAWIKFDGGPGAFG
ncbi:putative RNA recognition motif domain, nucleotide-binding alpha-beta plait domain superfamily [Helianthus annuus]|uniref:RNA recognition motif domain, nucleotide-binding alpha-beta plait domain superfamily n=1 Tax=Helianthus annuus TaxID=4232 RepID=A0A9K3ENH7_HELAN|nr:putative RNA recognition motif domain, nucleotide-binding alpha-beta plait domain superfamily [Helianthus annuus]KAJ0491795.1 putative RNA recognition motif domain, nucleotide-binding alpha-beta plait domain superfamily [Helianthus annuus]